MTKNQIQDPELTTRPKVAVVLGSGGIKALASIALFEFLDEAKINVDLLVGCSGGSIMAAAWAAGYSAPQMKEIFSEIWERELFSKVDYRTLLAIPNLPFGRFDKTSGIVKSELIHERYHKLYGDRNLEKLRPATILQTTDLHTGEGVLLSSGLVREAVYASGALFPILPAIHIDGRWLIDGVYSSPLPVMEAVKRDIDVVIAMTYEERVVEESNSFIAYFMRCIGYSHRWLLRHQMALSVDLHHHEIVVINVVFDRMIGLRAVHRIPAILELGQKAVDQKKDEILKAIDSFKE